MDWTNFFLAQLGASAALLGFLFVGVSVNLKIISIGVLANIALIGMLLLLAVLTVSSLMLLPVQSITTHGYFVLGVGFITWAIANGRSIGDVRKAGRNAPRVGRFFKLAVYEVATVPYLIAGPMLLAGNGTGYYWLAAAVILSIILAVTDPWALLVEINR